MKELAEPFYDRSEGEVHSWFGLTYSHYLVLQRSILQEMPTEWQKRFIACIEEINDYFDCSHMEDGYMVKLRDSKGRFKTDPLCDYRHPDFEYIDSMKWVKPKEDDEPQPVTTNE